MKKKYNPFKMWGSWVGAGIGLIFGYMKTPCLRDSLVDYCKFYPHWYILGIVIGFLIGWGIHSLIRKYG